MFCKKQKKRKICDQNITFQVKLLMHVLCSNSLFRFLKPMIFSPLVLISHGFTTVRKVIGVGKGKKIRLAFFVFFKQTGLLFSKVLHEL